jgi:Fe-S-cluster containining protein
MKDGREDHAGIPPEEQRRIKRMLERLMELGIGAVYADEDGGREASVDCEARLPLCRAVCCTFHFALTKQEAREGRIAHNPRRPFFIKRDEDGYCPHMDRDTCRCSVWPHRPARCRNYDCREDPEVWEDPEGRIIRKGLLGG